MSELPSEAPAPGALLAGKYVVERVLGQGGMGVVVAARHKDLDARVAVKLLRARPAPSVEAVERFQREARAAAKLKSDHVARVTDVGVLDDGTPFMVMEHLDGADLAEIVRAGPIAPGIVAELVAQACEAVAEAHDAGIVHRDLKPSNLFVTRTVRGGARVKVLDFGISKLRGADPGGSDALAQTAQGTMLGTPLYMSPEQMRSSRDVDARSDVWSLGLVAFELLTGAVPWSTESITALAVDVTTKELPDLHATRRDVPPGLSAVVRRCLEKDAAKRFGSASELGAALAPFREEVTSAITDALLARVPRTRDGIEAAATTPAPLPSPPTPRASPVVPPTQPGLGPTLPAPASSPIAPAVAGSLAPSTAAPAGGSVGVIAGGVLAVVVVAFGAMYAADGWLEPAGSVPDDAAALDAAVAPPPDAWAPDDAWAPPVHPRPCVTPPDPPCADDARAWCDASGARVACCEPGLVPTADGFCECPPGGADDAEAIASGCTARTLTSEEARERIRAMIRAHVPAMQRCYEAELGEGASVRGRIRVAFTVSPWGDLWDARIDASSLPSAGAQRCVLGELRAMRLEPPLPGASPLDVSYPLDFHEAE